MVIKIKKIHKDAIIPQYAHKGDAGMDLYTVESFTIAPNERQSVPIGLAFEIPEGYAGLIWDKSGLSHQYGIKTFGGVIDFSYRGEIRIGVINLSDKIYTFKKRQKIAQILIQKIEEAEVKENEQLSETERGDGGFGSSGK